jgi:hypothetical protein
MFIYTIVFNSFLLDNLVGYSDGWYELKHTDSINFRKMTFTASSNTGDLIIEGASNSLNYSIRKITI